MSNDPAAFPTLPVATQGCSSTRFLKSYIILIAKEAKFQGIIQQRARDMSRDRDPTGHVYYLKGQNKLFSTYSLLENSSIVFDNFTLYKSALECIYSQWTLHQFITHMIEEIWDSFRIGYKLHSRYVL